jgi:GT2 family glycosyltransferase
MISDSPKTQRTHPVSVVIPTLGGETLAGTIEQLNRGTIVPSEILVCIPEEDAYRVASMSIRNVRIVKTHIRGQVAQRAIGFQKAKEPLVLQLDDDIYLDETCLAVLIECMGKKKNVAIGPSLVDSKTGKPSRYMMKPDRADNFLYKLLFFIINGKDGYQPGKISKAGVNMAFSDKASEPYEVEWLSGGCLLHAQRNLIKYNYYPCGGKAYTEDLFHSAMMKRNEVKLYHCPKAICSVDNSSSKGNGILSLARIFWGSSYARYRFTTLIGASRLRLLIFIVMHHLVLLTNKLIRK